MFFASQQRFPAVKDESEQKVDGTLRCICTILILGYAS